MSLGPLLSARPPIPWHAFAALAALAIGATQLALPKGTTRHRVVGYTWAALMLVVAISSFLDPADTPRRSVQPDPSLVDFSVDRRAAGGLARAYASGRQHRRVMISLYVFALIGAGVFTLLPGRIMHTVVFGQ
ncbi:DUF2306 domain-containing protein [Mesorhizobium sp. W067]